MSRRSSHWLGWVVLLALGAGLFLCCGSGEEGECHASACAPADGVSHCICHAPLVLPVNVENTCRTFVQDFAPAPVQSHHRLVSADIFQPPRA
jgi:hypothetical protein